MWPHTSPCGKIITTSFPFMASAAAISDPMNPPPMTAKRCPCSVISRSRR